MRWNLPRLLAEALGTFLLVLVGTGAIVVNDNFDGIVTHAGVSLAFGGIVFLMIEVFGKISGAHINPAVTLGFSVANKFERNEIIPYAGVQMLGAFAASTLLLMMFPTHPNLGATTAKAGIWQTFVLELLLTALLMYIILIFSQSPRKWSRFTSIAVGLTVGLEAYFAGPLTGASMNPARSFGPAFVANQLTHFWVYLVATSAGAALAAYIWRKTRLFQQLLFGFF